MQDLFSRKAFMNECRMKSKTCSTSPSGRRRCARTPLQARGPKKPTIEVAATPPGQATEKRVRPTKGPPTMLSSELPAPGDIHLSEGFSLTTQNVKGIFWLSDSSEHRHFVTFDSCAHRRFMTFNSGYPAFTVFLEISLGNHLVAHGPEPESYTHR